MNPLIEALWEKSREPGMSVTKIAAKCDLSETYLYKMRECKRPLTLNFLRTVAREFPDLKPLVVDYIIGGDGQQGDEEDEQIYR